MSSPSILIQFDPEAWPPTVYLSGATDAETARLRELADLMIEAIKEKRPCPTL